MVESVIFVKVVEDDIVEFVGFLLLVFEVVNNDFDVDFFFIF